MKGDVPLGVPLFLCQNMHQGAEEADLTYIY